MAAMSPCSFALSDRTLARLVGMTLLVETQKLGAALPTSADVPKRDVARCPDADAAAPAGGQSPAPRIVSRSASRLLYRGRQPSSRLALPASMIAGWLAASIHCSCGGAKRSRGEAAATRATAAAGAPGTDTAATPSSRATSAPLSTPSPVML